MPKSHCSTTSGPGRLPCGSPFPHNHRQYHKASHRRQPCHYGKTPGYLQYPAGYCAHSHHTAGPPPASESSGQPAAANTAQYPRNLIFLQTITFSSNCNRHRNGLGQPIPPGDDIKDQHVQHNIDNHTADTMPIFLGLLLWGKNTDEQP